MGLIPKNRPDLTKDFLKLFPIEEAIRVAKVFELKNSLKISTNPNPNTHILDEFYTPNPLKTDNLRYQLDRDSILKAIDSSLMENTDNSSSSKGLYTFNNFILLLSLLLLLLLLLFIYLF